MESSYTEKAKLVMQKTLHYIQTGDQGFVFIIMIVLIGLLLILSFWHLYHMVHLESKECSNMNKMYPTINSTIHSINPADPDCKYTLLDYYIKTAYNCCSGGKYKNDFVDLCNLRTVIKTGARCLDFELYSVGDQPVVSSSTETSYHIKETFNSVPFAEVMTTINQYCFSNGTAPNPNDPVIIHLRIKSSNQTMFNNLADIFRKVPAQRLLGPEYGNENTVCENDTKNCVSQNLGNMKLTDLQGKIIVIVDRSNTDFMDNANFFAFVNITSNSMFMRALSYYDTRYTPDINELTNYNKTAMTIVMPDTGSQPDNPSGVLSREMGCQMVAMRYELQDASLAENEAFFNMAGYAFVLKPEALRFTAQIISPTQPNNPLLNFESRTTASDYYSFQT